MLFLSGTIPLCFILPFNLHFSLRNTDLGWTTKKSTYISFRTGVISGLGLGLVRVMVESNQIKKYLSLIKSTKKMKSSQIRNNLV